MCASVLSAVQVQDLFDSFYATVHFLKKNKMVKDAKSEKTRVTEDPKEGMAALNKSSDSIKGRNANGCECFGGRNSNFWKK